MKMMDLIILTLTAAIICIASWQFAHGSASCLTKSEARKLWPRKHIYWYSGDHCWSDRRGKPHNIKFDDPVFPKRSMAQADERKVVDGSDEVQGNLKRKTPQPSSSMHHVSPTAGVPAIMYPSLVNPMSPVDASLMDGRQSTLSYRLLDIDELTAKQPDPPDECCWPALQYDANNNPIGLAK